jgi:hypothetical protein
MTRGSKFFSLPNSRRCGGTYILVSLIVPDTSFHVGTQQNLANIHHYSLEESIENQVGICIPTGIGPLQRQS